MKNRKKEKGKKAAPLKLSSKLSLTATIIEFRMFVINEMAKNTAMTRSTITGYFLDDLSVIKELLALNVGNPLIVYLKAKHK